MNLTIKLNNSRCLVLILLCCCAFVALPIIVQGLPSGTDVITDFQFASAYLAAFINGILIPSWTLDNAGFGSLGTRLYPPVAFYTLAITQSIVRNWSTAFWLNMLGWTFLGCVGVFRLIKDSASMKVALFGGLLYSVIPQHLSDVYQVVLYAQLAACGILPFCFLFATRICTRAKTMDVICFAVSCSLLILSHIPTAIIFTLSLPFYCMVVTNRADRLAVFKRLLVSSMLVVAATSYYWIKVLTEHGWVAHSDPKYSTEYYSFSSWLFPNFLEVRQPPVLVIGSLMFDITIVLTALFLIPAIVLLIVNLHRQKSITFHLLEAITLTSLIALFMMSRPSYYVWYCFPLLQRIQFPWRWLSLLSIFAVVAFSLSMAELVQIFNKYARAIVYPAVLLILAVTIFDFTQIIRQSTPYAADRYQRIVDTLDTEPVWECWWPTWAKRAAFKNAERISAVNRTARVERWDAEDRSFVIEAGEEQSVRIATFYYPYWEATVNGDPVEVSKDENGAILIPTPAERAEVHLYFDEPPMNRIALLITYATWIVLGLILANRAVKYLIPIRMQ